MVVEPRHEMFPCPKATSVGSLVLQVAVIMSSEPMRPFDIMTDFEQDCVGELWRFWVTEEFELGLRAVQAGRIEVHF